MERKNLVNNLMKSMIDLAFPNVVKYLFWACENDTGIFEELTDEDLLRFRKMSKYKKFELACQNGEANEEDQAELAKLKASGVDIER